MRIMINSSLTAVLSYHTGPGTIILHHADVGLTSSCALHLLKAQYSTYRAVPAFLMHVVPATINLEAQNTRPETRRMVRLQCRPI
jgi:hypothetical protein